MRMASSSSSARRITITGPKTCVHVEHVQMEASYIQRTSFCAMSMSVVTSTSSVGWRKDLEPNCGFVLPPGNQVTTLASQADFSHSNMYRLASARPWQRHHRSASECPQSVRMTSCSSISCMRQAPTGAGPIVMHPQSYSPSSGGPCDTSVSNFPFDARITTESTRMHPPVSVR